MRAQRSWTTVFLILALASCRTPPPPEPGVPDGRQLARQLLIVDTHIDVPYRLKEKMEDISERTEGGDFDYPRARAGGLDVAFMSIYVPASFQGTGEAGQVADELIDMVEGFATEHPDKFTLVHGVADARRAHERRLVGLALGMENGAPIDGDLARLRHFHRRGIRYITLTHSKSNHICDSSYDDVRQWNGLSPFGREVVAEMNRLGIMVDVSHVSDEAFFQVLELSRAPVIASHSSCRHFTPDWERNMSDEMIRRLADNGGVIQINFGSAFLSAAAREQSTRYWAEVEQFAEAHGHAMDSPEVRAFRDRYWEGKQKIYADVSDVADHIDHVVSLVGIDHVGLGSDFDGVGDSLPTGLKDVAGYPNLIDALLERGYSVADVEQVCSGNLLRVWSEVERIADGA